MQPPVRDLLVALSTAIETQDADAAVALFWPEAIASGSSEDEVFVDAGIRDYVDAVLAFDVTLSWDWGEPVVRGVGDVHWFHCDGTLYLSGAKPQAYRADGVVRQQDGQWRFAMWSGSEPS